MDRRAFLQTMGAVALAPTLPWHTPITESALTDNLVTAPEYYFRWYRDGEILTFRATTHFDGIAYGNAYALTLDQIMLGRTDPVSLARMTVLGGLNEYLHAHDVPRLIRQVPSGRDDVPQNWWWTPWLDDPETTRIVLQGMQPLKPA